MKKIPTLFERNYETDRQVRDEVAAGCEWVLAGEGVATEKTDGTCCLIQNGVMFKRYELKNGRPVPKDFIPAQGPDPVTGDVPGLVRVTDGPEDKWHREAMENYEGWTKMTDRPILDGTYELVGPKVQGNIYRLHTHGLYRHGETQLLDAPRDYIGLIAYLSRGSFVAHDALWDRDLEIPHAIEGIVWHHPDGRMAKIKRRDFGLPWPVKE